jgi:alanine racemase
MIRGPLDPTAAAALAGRFPRSVALVNLDALAFNVRALLREVGPGVRLMAVVKANAYGHGAVPVAIAALRAGASMLAVAGVDEGIQLRQAGITAPVLLLGATPPAEMGRTVAHQLTPTVCDVEAAAALQAAAAAAGLPRVALHVKVDSGLHRFGVSAAEAVAFVDWLAEQPRLRVEGLYTHFSSAEEADGQATRREYACFAAVVAALRARGSRPLLHAANSAATLGFPSYRLDVVRVGLALYGLAADYPGGQRLSQWPVLEIHGRIGRVHSLAAGEAVGYGRTYIAPAPRRVALVSIGYADGFRRALSNRGQVLVNGRRAAVLGRVSMDQIVVDVTGAGAVGAGDLATVLGRQGEDEITAAEMAGWIDGIPHEVVATLGARLPRAYVQRGRLVGVSDLLGDHQLAAGPDDQIFRWPVAAPGASVASGS